MKRPACTVDTSKHVAMCAELARMTGAPFSNVVDYEVVKIVEKAGSTVPAAKVESLRRGAGFEGKSKEEKQRIFLLKKQARGLAKQGFWLIGKLLGFVPKAPGYVSQAKPSDGQRYDNTTVRRRSVLGFYSVFVETRQPTLQIPFVGGVRRFQRAINGRVRYFKESLKRGVFNSVKAIGKRYPGVKVG